MPFNGSGNFGRLYNWVNDRVNGIKILATRMDAEMDGFATGLSTCVTKDGQTTPTANLPMGGFKHTGVAVATATTEYTTFGQIRSNPNYFVASGTDTYAITPSPAFSAYAAGMTFDVLFTNGNTGAATLNVNGLGAKALTKDVSTALVSGDISAGKIYKVVYDGTRFQTKDAFTDTGITALTGDVTASGSGSVAATIANNAVTTAKINNSAVTLAKIANAGASSKLLGSGASGSGSAYTELTLGTGLSMSGNTLNAGGSTVTIFTSAAQASIAAAASNSVAHGLGGVPTDAWAILECTAASGGYSIGDVVPLKGANYVNVGYVIHYSSTNVGYTVGSGAFQIPNKSTGVAFAPSLSNFDFKLVAMRVT